MKKPNNKFLKRIIKKIFNKEKDMQGSDISGTWFNPKTGQKVIARQMISDGNETFVQTDQGMIDMNEFSQFIQMGDDVYDEEGNKTNEIGESIDEMFNKTQDVSHAPKHLDILLSKPLNDEQSSTIEVKALDKTPEEKVVEHKEYIPEKDINEEILDRAFAKIEGTPRIVNIEIDWDGLPIEKIKSMIELMDLSVADVSKYILKKYFKTTNIIENKITKELI